MKRFLSIELQKLWQNRASKVLIISYFVLLCFIALIASVKIPILNIRIADQGIFNFPFIWHFNTYIGAFFRLFLAIIVVSMITNEYSYGTLKQNLIDGLSKKELLKSKLLTIGLFSLVSTVFIFVLSIILGYSFSSYTELSIVLTDIDYLLYYFVRLFGFFSFCLFLGILVKRSAFALGFMVLWYCFEAIVYGVLRWNIFKSEIIDKIFEFFPLRSTGFPIANVVERMSFVKTIKNQMGVVEELDFSVNYWNLCGTIFWTFIFIYLSYRLLNKRDL